MIAKKKKMQHLTLFLFKKSVKKFEHALKKNAEPGEPVALENQAFEGMLYLPEPDDNRPSWLAFIQAGFPAQGAQNNRTSSALVFLRTEERIFALTFGHARHLLDPDSFERDFGLRVVVNRVSPEKIRGIRLRMFKETAVKRQEEAAKGTGLRTFGVDIQQDLLRGVTGAPKDVAFASRVSGADSLAIDAAMDFQDLPKKCKELLAAYDAKEYTKRGFDWIDNLKAVRSPSSIERLDTKLVAALKGKNTSVQMLCPDSLNRDIVTGFLYQGEKVDDDDQHPELEIDEWQDAIGGDLATLTVETLHERRIRPFDEGGMEIHDIPERNCFVFETNIKGIKYVLSAGEWFEVAKAFDDEINNYIASISKKPFVLPSFRKTWKDEAKYVSEASKEPDLMSLHKQNFTIEGSAVEPCDLLHRSGALVHVKVWSQSATFSHLLAQGAISAEALLRFPKFREHISKSATKHSSDIRKLFTSTAFVTSKLDVVLALIRKISKPLPFFSRLNLMREGQRIQRLGYRVSYQRIEVK